MVPNPKNGIRMLRRVLQGSEPYVGVPA